MTFKQGFYFGLGFSLAWALINGAAGGAQKSLITYNTNVTKPKDSVED